MQLSERLLALVCLLSPSVSLSEVSSKAGPFISPPPTSESFNTTLVIVPKSDGVFGGEVDSNSPFRSRKSAYRFDQVEIRAPTAENPSIDGFTQQICFRDPVPFEEESCIYANPTFNDHRGMVLFIRPSKLKMKIGSLGIFKPDAKLLTDPERATFPYKLEHMPHMGGVGGLATKKLQYGDLVLADYALAIVYADSRTRSKALWTPIFKRMIDLLPPKGREIFAKQLGAGETETEWILSAFQRNVFGVNEDGEFAFLPEPAYLNHDCRPNVSFKFNPETLQLEMHAVRTITPGEELTVSYIDVELNHAQRQKHLKEGYEFECGCSQCGLSAEKIKASDLRLTEIDDLRHALSDWTHYPPPTTTMAEHLIELYKAERLDLVIDVPYALAALAFNAVGLSEQARKYALVAQSYQAFMLSSNWFIEETVAELLISPESHWSYKNRIGPPKVSDDEVAKDVIFHNEL